MDANAAVLVFVSMFAPQESGGMQAFRLDTATGMIAPRNRQSTGGATSCFFEIDPSGRRLLVARYSNGSVAALPIHADGAPGAARARRYLGRKATSRSGRVSSRGGSSTPVWIRSTQ